MNRSTTEGRAKAARREALDLLAQRHPEEYEAAFNAALQRMNEEGYRGPIYLEAAKAELFKVSMCKRGTGTVDTVAVHVPGCIHNHHEGQSSGARKWRVSLVPAEQVVEFVTSQIQPSTRKRFKCSKCGGCPPLHELYPTGR